MAQPNSVPARYLVTAALPYANGPLHIGHLAGAYLPADIYVRYLRLKKEDVLFVCGSDEHGVAITIKARKEGTTPQALVDKYHQILKKSFDDFGISVDIFSRTTKPIHHKTAQEFFLKFYENKKFREIETEQYYDPAAKLFLADRYILGECPKCSNPNAYGDQCEKCGSTLNPTDLINPRSALSGEKPEIRTTKHWFLPLDEYQGFVQNYIDTKKSVWKPNVVGQCQSWLNDGLQARAMTRDMDWGIPLPIPAEAGGEGKVLYVWFDAPIGYISASKDWASQRADKNPQLYTSEDWKPYWQNEDTKLVHFIGKDNIVFHCVIFPCILDVQQEYIWADDVPANEFLNLEGEKLSTSRNWAVWAHDYASDFPNQIDVLRYVLTATMPETKDNDFTWKDFQTRNNSELVEIFGNFVNRVVTLIHKYHEGKIPIPSDFLPIDKQALASIAQAGKEIGQSIEKYQFRKALTEAMNLARIGNKYLTETEPWKLIKTQPERVPTVMYTSAQIVAGLAIVFAPFLPVVSQDLAQMVRLEQLEWAILEKSEILATGTELEKARLLFAKIEDEIIEQQVQKLKNSLANNVSQAQQGDNNSLKEIKTTDTETNNVTTKALKPEISYEDFDKIDIRVATILSAEKIKNADKLLKLEINTGLDNRTIVSGIAQFYQPEQIIGKQILVLANLAPRKLRGIESKGMILMAEDADGRLIFVQPHDDSEKNINGATVK